MQPGAGKDVRLNPVYIEAIGLFAPGFSGWNEGRKVLSGEVPYAHAPLPRYKPALLTGNEKRRATNSVRIAFGACENVIGDRLEEAASLASVFVSCGGDYGVHDQICRGLLQDQIMLSPTQFHNSVHNAPAGYWSIATGSCAPSVSLSAFDCSVSAGLMEALPLVSLEEQAALLVFSDGQTSEPMWATRKVEEAFAAAFWLTPTKTPGSIARLELVLEDNSVQDSPCRLPELEKLRVGNPAARVLPLLEGLARGVSLPLHFSTASGQCVKVTLDGMA